MCETSDVSVRHCLPKAGGVGGGRSPNPPFRPSPVPQQNFGMQTLAECDFSMRSAVSLNGRVLHSLSWTFAALREPIKVLYPAQPRQSRHIRDTRAAMNRRQFVNDMRDDVVQNTELLFLKQSSALQQSLAVCNDRV